MNVFQKVVNRITPKFIKQSVIKNYQSGKSDFSDWFGRNFFGLENSTLETNENIFSIVSRLSNTVYSLPFKLFKDYDQVNDEFTDKLIYNPNANQTLDEILRVLEVSRNTNGNGYALIMRDLRYRFDKLIPFNPNHVEPVLDRDHGEVWYRINTDGKTYFIHNQDVIHVKHISGNGNLKGISPIEVLKNSNEFDKAVREFSLKEMQTAKDNFILQYETNVSDEKKASIVNDFRKFYQDNGGVLIQEDGVKIEQMKRNFIAGDMKISEEITRDRIANVYNVPSIFLNSNSDSFSSNEQLMQMFVNLTLIPILKQYENEFNKKILNKDDRISGKYFKFNVNGLLRGDTAARTQFYQSGLRNGWITRDEVRKFEELAPRGGAASELWISGDMYPLEMDPSLRKTTSKIEQNGVEDVIDKD